MRSKILNKNINKKILFNIEWEPYMNYFDVIKYQKKLKKIEEKRRQKRLEYLKNKKSLSLKTKSRDRRPKERRNSVQPKERKNSVQPKERRNSVQPKERKDIPKSKESVQPKSRELKQKRITSYPKNVPKSKASPKNVPKSHTYKKISVSKKQRQPTLPEFMKLKKLTKESVSKRQPKITIWSIEKPELRKDNITFSPLKTIAEEIPEKIFVPVSGNLFNNTDF